ncbi:unnamed protein product [Penicillium bialowiezense]
MKRNVGNVFDLSLEWEHEWQSTGSDGLHRRKQDPVSYTGGNNKSMHGLMRSLEYFTKSAGPVRRVMLTYNQNGTSRGIASIIFLKPDTAAKAAKELNGLLVDGRPMKIEVVYDASHAPVAPVAKPLNERIAHKARPKSAAAPKAKKETKNTTAEKGSRRGARAGGARGRNPGRGKPKTVEELDAEMVDYFGGPSEAAPVNGAVPQANANQDIGMNDEIS